jgi:PAP2 superfamily
MRHWRVAVLAAVLGASLARADVLGDWTDILLNTAATAKQPPTLVTRTMAMVHVAMFDSINAVDTRYAPYKVKAIPAPGTSAEAAAAVAAHDILVSVFPAQAASLDAAQDVSLQKLTDKGIRASSLALGQRVAAAILALRASDGADAPNTWRPTTAPGVYVPTSLPVGTTWGKVTPWILEKSDQFHPAPPPALTSAEWARDYNEVKALGGKESTTRTAAQTETALFWAAPLPGLLSGATRAMMDVPGRPLVQNARLLALTSMVLADSLIAIFEAKYVYNFWRPITAIRDGDLDQNDATVPDRGWEPLVETPMHPEYPSAHCIGVGAVVAVLEKEFGAGQVRSFRLTSPGAPKASHSYSRLAELADEVTNARVWAGIHYRNSSVVGIAMGRKIGDYAWGKVLRPAK